MNPNIKYLLIVILFLAGLCFTVNFNKTKEGFMGKKSQCYDVLIKKSKLFYLYRRNQAQIPGVNPIRFNNLEEYVEFLEWQRSQGIRCPVLFYKQTYDAQNNAILKQITDPLHSNKKLPLIYPEKTNKLIDASRSGSQYNTNSYPGFDPYNQYVGDHTPLDKMFHSKDIISDSPIDSNWGGIDYTQKQVDSGKYLENIRAEHLPKNSRNMQRVSIRTRRKFNKKQDKMNNQINDYSNKYQNHRNKVKHNHDDPEYSQSSSDPEKTEDHKKRKIHKNKKNYKNFYNTKQQQRFAEHPNGTSEYESGSQESGSQESGSDEEDYTYNQPNNKKSRSGNKRDNYKKYFSQNYA